MRHWLALGVCVLAACGKKDAGSGKQRIAGAQQANVERMLVGLGYLSEEPRLDMLAEAVAEECGAACDCIRVAELEAGARATQLASCPSDPLPPDQAKLVDASSWIIVDVAGKYLADQIDAAGKQADELAEAIAAITVPLPPGPGLGGVNLPEAQNLAALPAATRYVAIAADGKAQTGTLPVAKLTRKGAVLEVGSAEDMAEVAAVLGGAMDEPPPPPPDEVVEDDSESGGDGTAMALDEGKMGKKDSDRAEGQYKMKNNSVDPQLARAQAIEAARTAGILGSAALHAPAAGGGAVGVSGQLPDGSVLVFADRGAPAKDVVDVLMTQEAGVIAVAQRGQVVALPLAFNLPDGFGMPDRAPVDAEEDKADLRIDVAADGVAVHVPRVAEKIGELPGAQLDGAALAALIRKGLDSSLLAGRSDVVVAVKDGATAAQLVAAVDAAITAGAREVRAQIWSEPPQPPKVRIGQPTGSGDLDKATIRRYVRRRLADIEACYTTALAASPDLAGTVTTQFLIMPTGVVGQINAKGVSADVSSCVAGVIKTIEFPEPKGGGPVNVTSYPFTFSPTGL